MSIEEKSRLIEALTLQNIGRSGVEDLYLAASRMAGGLPTLRAAISLLKAVENGRNIIVATGFTVISSERCETDGPIGSVVIGKLVNKIGSNVIFLTDPQNSEMIESLSKSARLESFQCLGFPIEGDLAQRESSRIVSEFAPAAVIAVERPGWNKGSIYHNMRGMDISSKTAKIDHLFNRAMMKGILTVGIGDGGNEIGMGNIFEAVRRHVPFGSMCQCPCRGGIASVTRVDHLLVSSVSNWGAYGLAAVLARLAHVPLEHNASDERRLIEAAVKLGAVDGVTGQSETSVDGLDIDKNAEVAEKIQRIIRD